jgi:hypothetical protein
VIEVLASETGLMLLAIAIVLITSVGIGVSVIYSLPYAIRRIWRYPKGSAQRIYAWTILFQIVLPAASLMLFTVAGTVLVAFDESPERSVAARLILALAAIVLTVHQITTPIGHSYTSAASRRERRAGKEDT